MSAKRVVHKSALAESDLIDIWLYTNKRWGERQADKYLDELAAGIERLARNPHIGVTCDRIRKGYRQLAVNQHMVFYQLTDGTIYVVRVLGPHMDFSRHLK